MHTHVTACNFQICKKIKKVLLFYLFVIPCQTIKSTKIAVILTESFGAFDCPRRQCRFEMEQSTPKMEHNKPEDNHTIADCRKRKRDSDQDNDKVIVLDTA